MLLYELIFIFKESSVALHIPLRLEHSIMSVSFGKQDLGFCGMWSVLFFSSLKQNTVIDISRVIKIETHVQELANET